jgi:hypothetical protein
MSVQLVCRKKRLSSITVLLPKSLPNSPLKQQKGYPKNIIAFRTTHKIQSRVPLKRDLLRLRVQVFGHTGRFYPNPGKKIPFIGQGRRDSCL